MSCTLITMLGTGAITGNKGYQKTKYKFPDGHIIETDLFAKALLEDNYKDFNRIIIVGTATSSWDLLLEGNESLWSEVYPITESSKSNKGIDKDLASRIEEYLSKEWGKEVIIKYHTPKVDNDTSQEIFEVYRSIIPELKNFKNTDSLLFDITHGFRSMPMLMYQALHFTFSTIQNLEIVYGEYIRAEQVSYVRNLSSYIQYAKTADALSVFKTKLDATGLADCIREEWPQGANALDTFSKIIQTNFGLQIHIVLSQIKNALNNLPENPSSIVNDVVEEFKSIQKLKEEQLSRTIFNFAKFQYEHNLIVQSIISLQLAVETAIAERYGDDKAIGNYRWWQDKENGGKNRLKEIWKKTAEGKKGKSILKRKLENLEYIRNQIAHGGARNPETLGYPMVQNLPNQYESGKEGVELLFIYLDKNPEN